MQLSGLKLLGGSPGRFPKLLISPGKRVIRQILSSVLLFASISLFASAMKCGTRNTNDPIPIITAPRTMEMVTIYFLFIISTNIQNKKCLTDSYPNRYMPPAAEVRDEDHGDNIANLVTAGNEPRETRRDFKPFLNCCNHRVYVPGAQCLLQRHKERKEKNKHL